ncbi:HNH endonuclease [Nostoc sp. CHAB 5824]|nr:HNH endonuclease [Nostoc sp. CHAB 5824]
MPLSVRFTVLRRDRHKCVSCGKSPPEVTLEVDHKEPFSKGGTNDISNLQTLCFDCNRGKGASS